MTVDVRVTIVYRRQTSLTLQRLWGPGNGVTFMVESPPVPRFSFGLHLKTFLLESFREEYGTSYTHSLKNPFFY